MGDQLAAALRKFVDFEERYDRDASVQEAEVEAATAEARAALTAFDAARQEGRSSPGGWRPIETAPKDGTPILAWCEA